MQSIVVENLRKVFSLKQKRSGLRGSLAAIFSPQYREVEAVKNISFTVGQGEIVAFIGPNGAGKSTTIKMLTGILYPSGGSVRVLGYDPSRERQKLAFHIGTVFGQKPQLWYHLPPQDTYDLLAKIYELDMHAYRERLQFLVESFEIEDLLETPVRKLSLGQRMRCEIVGSLLHRPKVIFLDEPTIGLDVIAKQNIREVIQRLNQDEQVTIFLTSHDSGDIEALAQRAMVINNGELVYDGTTEQFKKSFINRKTIEIVTEEPLQSMRVKFGEIVERKKYRMVIELDTSKGSLHDLLEPILKDYTIKDMNISDPPMEEIIANIYRDQEVMR